MKIHCPHCGVKGSADDSYRGQQLKCPKCGGMFEAVPEETVTTTPEDSLPEAVLPAISDDVITQPAEESTNVTPTRGKRIISDSVNRAPKVRLQWAQQPQKPDPKDETPDATDSSDIPDIPDTPISSDSFAEPEEPAFFDDSTDIAAFDELEEIVVTGPSQNDSEPDPEITFDENGLDEAFNEAGKANTVEFIDETELIDKSDDILNEPYDIEKEQCCQCGKKESSGEPFVAKDGQLYCANCVPVEEAAEVDKTSSKHTHSESETTDYFSKFTISGALREAWTKTKGVKASIWAGSAFMYLILLILFAGSAYLLPPLSMEPPLNITNIITNIFVQALLDILSVIFIAGLFYMGIRKVIKDPISWKMVFKGFSCAGKIVIVFILQSILISIGFLLLILPGIYLSVGYFMSVPLIVDRGLSPWQAMETSRKAIHKVWWQVAFLFFLMWGIILLSMIPLCIGLIWSWPMFFILVGVVYRYLFGIGKKTDQ